MRRVIILAVALSSATAFSFGQWAHFGLAARHEDQVFAALEAARGYPLTGAELRPLRRAYLNGARAADVAYAANDSWTADTLHYHFTAGFIVALLDDARAALKGCEEGGAQSEACLLPSRRFVFAAGMLTHYAGDAAGHRLFTNPTSCDLVTRCHEPQGAVQSALKAATNGGHDTGRCAPPCDGPHSRSWAYDPAQHFRIEIGLDAVLLELSRDRQRCQASASALPPSVCALSVSVERAEHELREGGGSGVDEGLGLRADVEELLLPLYDAVFCEARGCRATVNWPKTALSYAGAMSVASLLVHGGECAAITDAVRQQADDENEWLWSETALPGAGSKFFLGWRAPHCPTDEELGRADQAVKAADELIALGLALPSELENLNLDLGTPSVASAHYPAAATELDQVFRPSPPPTLQSAIRAYQERFLR